MRYRLTLLLLFLCFGNLSAQRVVAYLSSYNNADLSSLDRIQYDKITDLNYSFLNPNVDGSGALETWTTLQWTYFNLFLEKTPANVRKNISLQGDNTANSAIAADPVKRTLYVDNIVDFVETYSLDGVDMDWEFPQASEATEFALLMQELKDSLVSRGNKMGKYLELSIAVFPLSYGSAGINSTVLNLVDYVNVMIYNNNSLQNHTAYSFAEQSINYWMNTRGVPAEKLVLGVPFYATPAYSLSSYIDYNKFDNPAVASQANSYTQNGTTWYYNGQPLLREKVQLMFDLGLKGIMIWEIVEDRDDQYALLNAIDDEINSYSCDKPDFGNNEIMICGVDDVTLNSNLSSSGRTFVWSRNGITLSETSPTYTATQAGLYTVEVTEGSCIKSDIVAVIDHFPESEMESVIPYCTTGNITLDAGNGGAGINYTWDDGSGTIGTTQSISINAPGNYTVTFNDSKNHCDDLTASAEVRDARFTITTEQACLPQGLANLEVTEEGGPYAWYDVSSDGTLLHLGNSYRPLVTGTANFYVAKPGGFMEAHAGIPVNTATGWYNNHGATNYNNQLLFDAFTDMTIDTITVWKNQNGGTIIIKILDRNDVEVTRISFSNRPTGKNLLPLNLFIPKGSGYKMDASESTTMMWMDQLPGQAAFPYPYVTPNIMQITCTKAPWGNVEYRYAGFYNWKVSAGTVCPRTEVNVTMRSDCTSPEIEITSPTEGMQQSVPYAVIFTATASDDGSVSTVKYTIMNGTTVVNTVNGVGVNWSYTLNMTTAGNYTVVATATDNAGHANTSEAVQFTLQSVSSVEENTASSSVQIYPNPFQQNITIAPAFQTMYTFIIRNVLGEIVLQGESSGTITTGEKLTSGIYIAEIISEDHQEKIIIVKQ